MLSLNIKKVIQMVGKNRIKMIIMMTKKSFIMIKNITKVLRVKSVNNAHNGHGKNTNATATKR
jgi:hypothetical protein